MALTHLKCRFEDEAIQFHSRNHNVFLFFSFLLKWQKATGGRRSGARRGHRVLAESNSDPGAAAEEEETEEGTHTGASSVLSPGKVKIPNILIFGLI